MCQGGVCRCDGTLAYCAGECVNTKSDPDHCGSDCGVRCTGGQACVAGACTCESGSFCGDACVDTSVDRANCGGCDKPCGNPRTCSAGKCECASGLTFCSPGCVDAKTDQLNCGTCGMQCQGASQCVNGACKVCSTGCAVLSTTVADNSSNPWVTYGTKLNPPVDLVEASVTAVVYVATSVKPTFIEIHCDDTTDSSSSGTYTSMPIPATGWYKITAGQLTLAHVDLLELMLTNFDGVGTATVYVDSITISSAVAGPWDFTSSAAPLTYAPGGDVDPSAVSGIASWRNN